MNRSLPTCPDHPQSHVVRNGLRLGGRRQRYLCRPPEGNSHQLTRSVTEELVGACLTCRRDWDRGVAVARQARFLLAQAVGFLATVGAGASMREAAERVRLEREEFLSRLATVTGRVEAGDERGVSRHGRLAGDWLERYGAPVVNALMPSVWPAGTIAVDAKTFNIGARYQDDHPDKAGYPFPSGEVRFSVMAAAIRGPRGRMRICHLRAMPNDHKPSWVDFFRSLPGKPDTILSDPDPQIDYALREVWPDETPLHPLSTWHYWAKIQEKFVAARLYPWTDVLCRDSEAAFKDPQLFRAWRARAASEAPRPIRTWLKKKGDEVQIRLEGATPPLAIGDLETFLNQRVAYAVDAARGKIRNLRRLDIRLALIALDQNRQLKPSLLETILDDQIEVDGARLVPRRSLDGVRYNPTWLLSQSVA